MDLWITNKNNQNYFKNSLVLTKKFAFDALRWLPSPCGSLCSSKKNPLPLSPSQNPEIPPLLQKKIISLRVSISLKKICVRPLWKNSALCLDLSTKKRKIPLRVLSNPYLYGSTFLLLDILFPFLMHMDMESACMVAHIEDSQGCSRMLFW